MRTAGDRPPPAALAWALAAFFVPAMVVTGLAVNWRMLLWGPPLSDPPATA